MPEIIRDSRARSLPSRRLTGWKDIAGYLGRSVRTVQRWEKELGLPVRRVGHPGAETVFALAQELDGWLVTPGGTAAWRQSGEIQTDAEAANRAQLPADDTPSVATADSDLNSIETETNTAGMRRMSATGRKPASRPRSWAWLWKVAVLIAPLAVAAAVFVPPLFRSDTAAAAAPARVEVFNGDLRVTAEDGTPLWNHSFELPLADCAASSGNRVRFQGATSVFRETDCEDHVFLQDVDGNGMKEVIVLAGAGALFCFEPGGALRWRYAMYRPVRFQEVLDVHQPGSGRAPVDYRGWHFSQYVTIPDEGARPTVWFVGHHHTAYPAFAQRLDLSQSAPKILSEYWNPGWITTMAFDHLGGRNMVFLGGSYEESGGASLAVFIDSPVQGSAPSVAGDRKCLNCPPGAPDAFLVFPRSAFLEQRHANARVEAINSIAGDRVLVDVSAAPRDDARDGAYRAIDKYMLDKSLKVVATEIGFAYEQLQRRLETTAAAVSRRRSNLDLFPVLRFYGGVFTAQNEPVASPDR